MKFLTNYKLVFIGLVLLVCITAFLSIDYSQVTAEKPLNTLDWRVIGTNFKKANDKGFRQFKSLNIWNAELPTETEKTSFEPEKEIEWILKGIVQDKTAPYILIESDKNKLTQIYLQDNLPNGEVLVEIGANEASYIVNQKTYIAELYKQENKRRP